MRTKYIHSWNVDTRQAKDIQKKLAGRVDSTGKPAKTTFIAGLDVSVTRDNHSKAAAVVLSYPDLVIRESVIVEGTVVFPYVPGLLSFREMPITLRAFKKLKLRPDLVMVDGQGMAHPRRFGLASHLGLFLNLPTIGCAKTPLFGEFDLPGEEAGSVTVIKAESGEVIGKVLRTRSHIKPLFISVGHKIDLASAVKWVLLCCQGYRLPEPTRQAHLASKNPTLFVPESQA